MAISPIQLSAGIGEPVTAFTMSLIQGWDRISPEQGGRPLAAGDLVLLEVRKPAVIIAGPSGWTQVTDRVFCKTIGPPEREQPPVFTAEYAGEWEVYGCAVYPYPIDRS